MKNNLVFESGSFPFGTGDASNQVTVLDIMTDPATGLPYVLTPMAARYSRQ